MKQNRQNPLPSVSLHSNDQKQVAGTSQFHKELPPPFLNSVIYITEFWKEMM